MAQNKLPYSCQQITFFCNRSPLLSPHTGASPLLLPPFLTKLPPCLPDALLCSITTLLSILRSMRTQCVTQLLEGQRSDLHPWMTVSHPVPTGDVLAAQLSACLILLSRQKCCQGFQEDTVKLSWANMALPTPLVPSVSTENFSFMHMCLHHECPSQHAAHCKFLLSASLSSCSEPSRHSLQRRPGLRVGHAANGDLEKAPHEAL